MGLPRQGFPAQPTPLSAEISTFLLDFFHRETDGASLEINVDLGLANASLAAQIAAASTQL